MKHGTRFKHVTEQERRSILVLYSHKASGPEIAKAMSRSTSTIYRVLEQAGVHERVERVKRNDPPEIKLPEPTPVEPGTITLIRGPQRSLWQRIKDFFA